MIMKTSRQRGVATVVLMLPAMIREDSAADPGKGATVDLTPGRDRYMTHTVQREKEKKKKMNHDSLNSHYRHETAVSGH